MARGDSSIRVDIIGDARKLQSASKEAERSVGRVGSAAKTAGGIIAGAFATTAVLDFAQDALGEFDRLGDATTRLEEQLGGLADPLIATADQFHDLGGSRQDVLELQARFADLATAAGVADEKIAGSASAAAETALALSLITDSDADTILDNIGKAAGGSDRPLKDLGISLSDAEVEARALEDTGKKSADALTDNELAAARLQLILEKLRPRVDEVTSGTADLEQRQRELQAKFETLTAKIGEGLEGPLNDLLAWILQGIDGWTLFAEALGGVERQFDDVTGAAGEAVDAIRELISVLASVPLPGLSGLRFGASAVGSGGNVNVNVQGGSPEVIEQAVRQAVDTIRGHGPWDSGV